MKITLTIIFTFICSCLFAQEVYDKKMPENAIQEDFEIFKNAILTVHPNLHLYCTKSKSDSTLNQIKKSLNREMSPLDFFRVLTPYVHSIRNAHTTIRPPQSYINYVTTKANTLPLKVLLRNDSLVVVENYSSNIKINPGAIITKINGILTDSLMMELAEFTFVDGYNENYSKFLTSQYLNTRYAYAIGLPEVYEIDLINSDGSLTTETIHPIYWKEPLIRKNSNDKDDKYTFHISNDIAFLSISSFIVDLKPFRKFLKKTFAKINEGKIKHLVIDMRDNRGGSQEATNVLLGYFIKETIMPIKEKYALVNQLPNQEYYNKDYSFNYFHKEKLVKSEGKYIGVSDAKIEVRPAKNPFMDNIFFLINENCASATTSFLGQIRTHRKDALFIGRETLGNPAIVVADYTVSLVLPNSKIVVKLPLISSEKNVSFENPKRGVVPDIEVSLTIEELQLESDKIKEKAIEEIIKLKKTGHNKD